MPKPDEQTEPSPLLAITGLFMILVGVLAIFQLTSQTAAITALILAGSGLLAAGALLPRLDGEFEIGARGIKGQLKTLNREVTKAEQKLPQRLPKASYKNQKVEDIPRESATSPSAALLRLARLIESTTLNLLAETGWISTITSTSFRSVIKEVQSHKYFPSSLTSSIEIFWSIRSKLLHSGEVDEQEGLRAIDLGLSILKMLEGIPHETNIVYNPGVPIYADPECKVKREGVEGIILETISPGGVNKSRRIFPVTRKYQIGQRLSWEWSFERTWDKSWYRDPDSGEIKEAWLGSAEFTGSPLN